MLALAFNAATMVASMHLEKTKSQGKYTCYLLRETYRQNGKVKHRTIANLSGCSAQEIEAIRLALKHKDELTQQLSLPQQDIDLRHPRFGALQRRRSVCQSGLVGRAPGEDRRPSVQGPGSEADAGAVSL